MDSKLINNIITSGIVLAVVSGIIGLITALKVEKTKSKYSKSSEKTKNLGEAHDALLSIKDEVQNLDLDDTADAQLLTVVNDIKENFNMAKTIFNKVSPLLVSEHKNIILNKIKDVEETNTKLLKIIHSEDFKNDTLFDQKKNILFELLKKQITCIETIKLIISEAYSLSANE